jgi:hypothetical protein
VDVADGYAELKRERQQRHQSKAFAGPEQAHTPIPSGTRAGSLSAQSGRCEGVPHIAFGIIRII